MNNQNRLFKDKIKYLFIRYAFIPILILLISFLIFIFITSNVKAINNAKKSGKLISNELNEIFYNYKIQIEKMSKSESLINFVDTRLNSNLIYEEIYRFNNKQKIKSVYHIINKDGLFLAYTTPSDPELNDAIFKTVIPRIDKNPNSILCEANKFEFSYNRGTVYTFGNAILKDSNIIGYVICQLYEEDIQKLIFISEAEVVVITDQYDRIIASTSNVVKGLMNKFSPSYTKNKRFVKIKDGNGNYHMIKNSLDEFDVNIYTLNSVGHNKSIFILYGIFASIISLFIYILLNYLANKMSLENTKSIDKLLTAVYDLQRGNMDSYVDVKTGDEFEVLANQYNIMLDNLNQLIKKNEEISNIKRIKEIKQLQAQFNPHFLFNVLETLRYTIVLDQKEAQDIVISLSRLLRYSIKNDDTDVLFMEDLAYMEDYLKLHKIRFKDKLNYTIEVSDEVKNAIVPKLLLQVIIENSIKYGYATKDYLDIKVSGEVVDDTILFNVKDNGTGMTEDHLNYIRNILNDTNNSTKHIGLYNIHRRLVLLYGEGYGLKIRSTYGEGTSVTIIIPYKGRMTYVQDTDS